MVVKLVTLSVNSVRGRFIKSVRYLEPSKVVSFCHPWGLLHLLPRGKDDDLECAANIREHYPIDEVWNLMMDADEEFHKAGGRDAFLSRKRLSFLFLGFCCDLATGGASDMGFTMDIYWNQTLTGLVL